MYGVRVSPLVLQDMNDLTAEVYRKITTRILGLAQEPRAPDCEPLPEVPNAYRVVLTDIGYRILYVIDDEQELVKVFALSRY